MKAPKCPGCGNPMERSYVFSNVREICLPFGFKLCIYIGRKRKRYECSAGCDIPF